MADNVDFTVNGVKIDTEMSGYSGWYGVLDGQYGDQITGAFTNLQGTIKGGSAVTFTLLRTDNSTQDIHHNKLIVEGGKATSTIRAIAPYSSGTEAERLQIHHNVLEVISTDTDNASQAAVVHGNKATYVDVYENSAIYKGGNFGFLRAVLVGGNSLVRDNSLVIDGSVTASSIQAVTAGGSKAIDNSMWVKAGAELNITSKGSSYVALAQQMSGNTLNVDGTISSQNSIEIQVAKAGKNENQGVSHTNNELVISKTGSIKGNNSNNLTLYAGFSQGSDSSNSNRISISGSQAFQNLNTVWIYSGWADRNQAGLVGDAVNNVVSLVDLYDLKGVNTINVYGGHSKFGTSENVHGNVLNIAGTVELSKIGYGNDAGDISSFQEINISDNSSLTISGTMPLIGTTIHLGKDAKLDVGVLDIRDVGDETNHLTFTANFANPNNEALIQIGELKQKDGQTHNITIDAINIVDEDEMAPGSIVLFEGKDGADLTGLNINTVYDENVIAKTVTKDGIYTFTVDTDNVGQVIVSKEERTEEQNTWEDILNSPDEALNAFALSENIVFTEDVKLNKDFTIFGNGQQIASGHDFSVEAGNTLKLDDVDMIINHLTNKGELIVGLAAENSSTLSVNKFTSVAGSKLVVDPSWDEQPSVFAAQTIEGTIAGDVVAARNSIVALGSDADVAKSLLGKFGQIKETGGYQAAVIISKPISLTGKLLANGEMSSNKADTSPYAAGTLTVTNGGLLVLDNNAMSVDQPMIDGAVDFESGSTLAIAHAKEGTFQLAETVKSSDNVLILNDGDYLETVIQGNTIQNRLVLDLDKAMASMGMQAVASRAATNFSDAINTHLLTSKVQTEDRPLNLWVTVGGEKVKADGLNHNAQYKSEVGYSHVGADVLLSSYNVRIGGALQYNDGSIRSSNYKIKNNVDGFGFAAYASWLPCPGAHLTAKTSYIEESHGLSGGSQFFKLNSDVTTEVYTIGLSTGYTMNFGQFAVTPEVELLASRITTSGFANDMGNVDREHQNIVQMPLAVNVSMNGTNFGDWSLKPAVRLSYTPTFGDKNYETIVTNNGNVHHVDARVLNSSMFLADFGLSAEQGPWHFDAQIKVGSGNDDTTSLSGHLGLSYAF